MPTKLGLKDGAIKNLSPCVLTGTPEELDLEFTDKLTQPLKKVIGLLTNMDIVEKSIEATQAKSKLATEAKKKEETEIKAYSEKIKKVETLFSEKRTILLSRLYASF